METPETVSPCQDCKQKQDPFSGGVAEVSIIRLEWCNGSGHWYTFVEFQYLGSAKKQDGSCLVLVDCKINQVIASIIAALQVQISIAYVRNKQWLI